MKDITDADYALPKRFFKDFEIKNLGEHHGWYVPSNKLLLAEVCENFENLFVLKYMSFILQNFFQLLN